MIRESLKTKGKVKLILTSEDGTVKTTMVKNTVVDIGLNHIINRLAGDLLAKNMGSSYDGLNYQVQTISDGTTVTVDGTQGAGSSIIVTDNTTLDSNEFPLLVSGTGISGDTYVTSLTGTTIINLNQAHAGVTDTDTIQIGETIFTDVGASANTVGETFAFDLPTVNATTTQFGHRYEIVTTGTTDFTLIGSPNSTPGTRFTATGVGVGTGTVKEIAAGTGTVRPKGMSHMAVGSGTTTQVAADSDLESQLARVVLGTENLSLPSLTYSANFGPGVGTGAITEAGIFNEADSSADMLCRTTFPVINKGVSDALEVQWIITITR